MSTFNPLEGYPGGRIAKFQRGLYLNPLSLEKTALVDVGEASRQLNYTPAGIRCLIKNGQLKASKHGGKWWVCQQSINSFKSRS